MSCPICGANCKCRNRGEGGLCCSCHRHKVKKILVSADALPEPLRASYRKHLEWLERQDPTINELPTFFPESPAH